MKKLNPDKLGTEEIYYLLKKKAKSEQQNLYTNSSRLPNNDENWRLNVLKSKKSIYFSNTSNWRYSNFTANYDSHENLYPVIPTKQWEQINFHAGTSIDIINKIFKCEEKINYGIVNNKISGEILLKGESYFWIFLHVNEEFDEKTIVIIFSKDKYNNIARLSLGTFLSFDNRINFYILQKQQLIENYTRKHKTDDFDDDCNCKINFSVEDEGSNIIKINAKVNDGEAPNELKGNYFQRIDNGLISNNNKNVFNENLSTSNNSSMNKGTEINNYGIMIAGSGQECILNQFRFETVFKSSVNNLFKRNSENCTCCNIY